VAPIVGASLAVRAGWAWGRLAGSDVDGSAVGCVDIRLVRWL